MINKLFWQLNRLDNFKWIVKNKDVIRLDNVDIKNIKKYYIKIKKMLSKILFTFPLMIKLLLYVPEYKFNKKLILFFVLTFKMTSIIYIVFFYFQFNCNGVFLSK